jgi:L,D-peptidoglycan transpeptidase YkuD (ErfK/YbiS/YcfS/YnhG family)
MINKIQQNTKLVFTILMLSFLHTAHATNYCNYLNHKGSHEIKSKQVLVIKNTHKFHGVLYLCEKNHNIWGLKKIISIVLGRNGVIAAAKKREGDGYTPTGVYNLGPVFGQKNLKLHVPYIKIVKDHKWIDDANHQKYNTLIYGKTNAGSYENVFIPEYNLGVVVQYNMRPVIKNKGSAIFLHIWHNPETPTAGCIAMSYKDIYWLVNNLKMEAQIVIE